MIHIQPSVDEYSALAERPGVVVLSAADRQTEGVFPGTDQVLVSDLDTALTTPEGRDFLLESVHRWADSGKAVTLFAEREPEELLAGQRDSTALITARLLEFLSRFKRRSSHAGRPVTALARRLHSIPGLDPSWQQLLLSECAFDAKLHTSVVVIALDLVEHKLQCTPANERRLRERLAERVAANSRRSWVACTADEQFALAFLAEESFVNPASWHVLCALERRGRAGESSGDLGGATVAGHDGHPLRAWRTRLTVGATQEVVQSMR